MYVKVDGVWRYVYRAVGQRGQVIDVLVSARRDAAAARRFFRRALTMVTWPGHQRNHASQWTNLAFQGLYLSITDTSNLPHP